MIESFLSSPLVLIIICCLAITGYVPLNRCLKEGHHCKSPLDDRIVLVPIFVIPYIFIYVPWLVWFYLSLYFRPLTEIQIVTLATVLSTTIGYCCFYFFPTYVKTAYPVGKSFFIKTLQLVHHVDKKFNACPSMHVFIAVLLTIFTSQRYPNLMIPITIAGFSIIISTVLTKRHYLYDIGGGVIVGLMSYAFSTFLLQ